MGNKYSKSKISTQLRKTTTIADLVKTIQFFIQIYKIVMLKCAQLGFCPTRGMKWSIAVNIIDMNLATCNCLFCQFCRAYRRGLYGKSDQHNYYMRNWRVVLDSTHSGNKMSHVILIMNKSRTSYWMNIRHLQSWKHTRIMIFLQKQLCWYFQRKRF